MEMHQTVQDPILSQATALYTYVSRLVHPDPSRPVRMLLLAMSILSPTTAILFIIAGIKRQSLLGGFWLFRINANGYLHPNMFQVISLFVFLYTILGLSTLISLQKDIQSSTISARTIILTMMSFPALLGLGWTRTWCVLNAIPPTKTGLNTGRNQITSSNFRLIPPKLVNAMAIFVYIVPFILSAIISALTAKRHRRFSTIWHDYEASYLGLMTSEASEETRRNESLALLGKLVDLREISNSLFSLFKILSAGYLIAVSALLVTTLFAHFHILRALCYQLEIHRKSVETRQSILISFLDKEMDRTSFPSSFGANQTGASSVLDMTSSKVLFSSQESPNIETSFQFRWMKWLPILKRDTGIHSSVWKTGFFTVGNENWETSHINLIVEQHNVLRRFLVNTVWQLILMCLVMLFYMALNWVICANMYDVPATHSLLDLCFFVITYSCMIWNLGIGTLYGAITCVVAFSPEPKLQREPETIADSD